MAHTNTGTIQKIRNLNRVQEFKELSKIEDGDSKCASCSEGKISKASHSERDKKKREILELAHSDLSGKIRPISYKGDQYLQLLVDDASGATWAGYYET